MTPLQHRVLSTIRSHIAAGRAPTYRGLAGELRVSLSTIHRIVHELADQGAILLAAGFTGAGASIQLPDGIAVDVLDTLTVDGLERTARRVEAILASRREAA